MKTWTIDDIRCAMTNNGSHWWDRGTMRFFGTRVSEQVYQGEGGIYFVTSEKPPHGARRYSVRQFKPDSFDIATIGEFCSLSRSQAHREAARLAGASAVVAASAVTTVSAAEQLAIDIIRGGGQCTKRQAKQLISLASRHQRLMAAACNGDVELYDADGEPSLGLVAHRKAIEKLATECGCVGVVFGGDPRGATVKLKLPNRETNDWGNEGWCVPTK